MQPHIASTIPEITHLQDEVNFTNKWYILEREREREGLGIHGVHVHSSIAYVNTWWFLL